MRCMKPWGVVGLGCVVALVGCGSAAVPAVSVARATVTVTAPPVTPSAPPVAVLTPTVTVTASPSENPNDPISTSNDDAEGTEVQLTKAQRAQCFHPGQDILAQLYYDSPVPGINQKLQNLVAWRSDGAVFAAIVTDFDSG